MKFKQPGDLLKASRDPRNKRAVMKAIGMPMKKRKSIGAVKDTGTFQGKSNALGHGGRAAQLKARGVPGGVIGALARRVHAAPGQANYHSKKKAKKRKGSDALIGTAEENKERDAKRYKGSMSMVKSPKMTSRYQHKKAKKNYVAGGSFGDETLQDTQLEHARERMSGVKKGAKKRKVARKGIPSIKMPPATRNGMVPKVKLPTMKAGGQALTAPKKFKRKSVKKK